MAEGDERVQVEHEGGVLGEPPDEDGGGLLGKGRGLRHGIHAPVGDGEARGLVVVADELAHAEAVDHAAADEAAAAARLLWDGVALIAVEGCEDGPPGRQPAGGRVEVEEAVSIVAVYDIRGRDVGAGPAPGRQQVRAGQPMDVQRPEPFPRGPVGVREHGHLVAPFAQPL